MYWINSFNYEGFLYMQTGHYVETVGTVVVYSEKGMITNYTCFLRRVGFFGLHIII